VKGRDLPPSAPCDLPPRCRRPFMHQVGMIDARAARSRREQSPRKRLTHPEGMVDLAVAAGRRDRRTPTQSLRRGGSGRAARAPTRTLALSGRRGSTHHAARPARARSTRSLGAAGQVGDVTGSSRLACCSSSQFRDEESILAVAGFQQASATVVHRSTPLLGLVVELVDEPEAGRVRSLTRAGTSSRSSSGGA